MTYAFPPAEPVSLKIAGTDARFPVRRIYCVGRNYADHVKEMGGTIERSEPVFFTKAAETLVPSGANITFPPNTTNLHYEVELVVAIGPNGIFGYAVGIDLTRRDLQSRAKQSGNPARRCCTIHRRKPRLHCRGQLKHSGGNQPQAGNQRRNREQPRYDYRLGCDFHRDLNRGHGGRNR